MLSLGLFHGLVYLPVLLSLIGPKPYGENEPVENQEMSEPKNADGKKVADGKLPENGKKEFMQLFYVNKLLMIGKLQVF